MCHFKYQNYFKSFMTLSAGSEDSSEQVEDYPLLICTIYKFSEGSVYNRSFISVEYVCKRIF